MSVTIEPVGGFEHLHVVGAKHPLQQAKRRLLVRAAVIALLVHVAGFSTILLPKLFRGRGGAGHGDVQLTTEQRVELPAPPSISGGPAGPVIPGFKPGGRPPTAALGIPDPVPDLQAEAPTIAAQSEVGAPINPDGIEGLGGGGGGGGSWNLDTLAFNPGDQFLSPDAFVAVDDPPVLINMPAPEYPRNARDAGIQGQVVIRALVDKDGKVKRTLVGSGAEVLAEAAASAVRRALFKPAVQNNHPVAVWVAVPVNFSIQ